MYIPSNFFAHIKIPPERFTSMVKLFMNVYKRRFIFGTAIPFIIDYKPGFFGMSTEKYLYSEKFVRFLKIMGCNSENNGV
jgi:hypothetical protein